MLSDYINNKYLSNSKIKSLMSEFQKNKPFPHIILKDFFNEEFINKVLDELKKQEFIFRESDIFSFSQTSDFANFSLILGKFYNLLNSEEFKEYLFIITEIKASGRTDCSGFIYTDKDYLLPHDDRLESRKIAYVLNLSENFEKKDGGILELFDNNRSVKSIIPGFNTLTIFKVIIGKTIHQVSEVLTNKKRYSIAGWFND